MIVKELLELLKYVPDDLLLTVLDQHGLEYPLGAPTITLEGGGASPRFAAINIERINQR